MSDMIFDQHARTYAARAREVRFGSLSARMQLAVADLDRHADPRPRASAPLPTRGDVARFANLIARLDPRAAALA
jgi:hypothetical protein